MSLVNDMLRDLDQRRQEPARSGVGFGAERLVPVHSEEKPSGSNRSLISFVLAIAVTLVLITGGIYFWQSSRIPEYAPTPQPAFIPAPVAAVSPAVDPRELEQINQRMQQLEAENQALLEAQARAEALAAAQAQSIAAAPSAESPVLNSPQSNDSTETELPEAMPSEVVAAIASSESPAVQASSTPEELVMAQEPAPAIATNSADSEPLASANTSIRSPRTLSFPEQDLLQVQEAQRLAASNQIDLALQRLQAFVAENPNAHESREAMVKLALQRGDSTNATQWLQEGFALDAMRTGYRKLQARMMLSSGRAEEALQLLGTRIPAIDEDVEYHDILATAYLSMQDYDNAAKSYEALVQQNRNEGRWWYGLGFSWESLGRKRDAKLAYEEALKRQNLSASLRQRSQQRIVELGL